MEQQARAVLQNRKICYAFIDSQNLNLAIQALGWKLDFTRFRIFLRERYLVQKAFLFIGFVRGNEALYQELKKSGYLLIFKPTIIRHSGTTQAIKGNVDAELVLHAMI